MKAFLLKLIRGKSRKAILILFDLFCFGLINAAYFLLADHGFNALADDVGVIYLYNVLLLGVSMAVSRLLFKAYRNIWRYTSTNAYIRIVFADATGGIVALLLSRFAFNYFVNGFFIGLWFFLTVASLTALITLSSRFTYRLLYKRYKMHKGELLVDQTGERAPKIPVGIVGAGQLGAYLANELANSLSSHYEPKCFIDIDKVKIGNSIAGLPVYSADKAESIVVKYGLSEVIFAINNLSNEKIERLWNRYSSFGCKIKIYDTPFLEEKEDDKEIKRVIRDFSIEDLLFRKPIDVSKQTEFGFYNDKIILVTGGGGSIGSELCRQIAKCSPKKLIIFDIYENNAYDIEQELIRKYGKKLDLCVEIGSVRDKDRLECIFKNYKPQIVFHAAAHKHVPLMQHSSCEAIKNNVLGTYNSANMAEKYGVEKFILISTDKAVNPTNVMGASKRLCEMVIQCRTDSKTSFAAVRFGNVLGSNGSVIPLFKRQVMSGGPITITDKRIIRYFMTIPEASQLVMLAGAKANKGELFVLDMGQPVKIYDLAVNIIKLMGFTPGKDIEIKEVGLRPGEKLYEELLMKNETLIKTDNKMIFVEKDKPCSREEIEQKLAVLVDAVERAKDFVDSGIVLDAIRETVPTYVDPEKINANAANTEYFKNTNQEKQAN